jgi:hypothetical protein
LGPHGKTVQLLEAAKSVLAEQNPMTVRQLFYQLVSRQAIENTDGRYQAVIRLLVEARKEGTIPWDWIEDRLRRPRCVSMWDGLADFADAARRAYRRDIWENQSTYFEAWLEKDALSGIFEDILGKYGVTLNVGRGYDGWDSIRRAARRFGDGKDERIIYFGDFDPSGEDMAQSLCKRLGFFGCLPDVTKVAVTPEDVERYQLPPSLTKKGDTRRGAFVKEFGDRAVELDALPLAVLRERIVEEVESRMDLEALAETRDTEEAERAKLVAALSEMGSER